MQYEQLTDCSWVRRIGAWLVVVACAGMLFPGTAGAKADAASQAAVKGASKTSGSGIRKARKKKRVKKKRRRRRRWCDSRSTPAYRRMKARWQRKPRVRPPRWKDGYRDLILYSVNLGVRKRIFVFDAQGKVTQEALDAFAAVMADKDTGHTHPVDPRLVKLVYKLAVRFKAPQVNVISGFREPDERTRHESHHANGTAIDFMLPGVPLPAVAKAARRLGHVGVGYYPVSGFVHLDVRAGPSYFWVDRSGPGKSPCLVRIMASAGAQFDRKWRPEKDEPVPRRTERAAGKKERPGRRKAKKQSSVASSKRPVTRPAAPEEDAAAGAGGASAAAPI